MASSAAATGDGEKPHAHLGQPLLAPPHPAQQPYYAYPAASYAHPSPPPPAPTLVFVPVLAPCSPVLVRLRRLRPRRAPCLRRLCTRTLPLLLFLALLAGAAFLLYPSAPAARVADLRVDSFRVQPPVLGLGLALRLRVRNPGFVLPLRYRSVSAAVSYRGHLLGSAKAWPGSGELAARHEVYADAQVWVDAGRVLDDVIELIGDVAAGSVPLEIVSEVVGSIEVFRFHIPVKDNAEVLGHVVFSMKSISLCMFALYVFDAILMCVKPLNTPAVTGAHIMLSKYQPRDSENHKPGLLLSANALRLPVPEDIVKLQSLLDGPEVSICMYNLDIVLCYV
ncbi:unnamed protein product [Miscanthus lutarioriparius]|uniref:Late embryogenesis abundant protein LEA-2 subgroup domain-containing protein n=1 Tax=Miscanthus lutarioriparius TaxID=422564 RepID=A0A811NSJ3_9POAL|nr:unnamed protein product [Miscanthus lutarioriparius]